ncbi:sensor histidine kinase [Sedimenticola selenatireducens]|uniref:histidine kinase n=1 Tax=Sedimenticola selenatireducens TaxID=191960 RepID=A0A558DU30_9GAMM|nr:ATP-binding protein [Sedimenticola selenatireducens]TVO76965.1 HAMP domain-containing protein [Sedimenticola selenatireducens]TVT64408.1 MAG: HAMP domain-containing protein [Sedimenticola selenatireducens]
MASATLKRLTSGALPVITLLLIVLVSLHLMSGALQNTEELSRLFIPLLVTSVLGLFAMVIVVGVNIVQMVSRYRRQASGSRLALRLVVVFVALSLAPVSVVYYYSQQFLLQGIDSWFDVHIDQSMDDALRLGQASLDLHKLERLKVTQLLLDELSGSSVAGLSLSLEELREQFGASELVLLDLGGKIITSVNADPSILVTSKPDGAILQQLRSGEDYVGLEPAPNLDGQLEVRVAVADGIHARLLLARYPVTRSIADLTTKVEASYSRYKELAFLRKSLKNTFTLSLAMVLLFSLLAAIWAAFFTARRLVKPVAGIAEGTRAVAEGNYGMQLPVPKSRDELGFLVESFNSMSRRIEKSRDETARTQRQVEAQRTYLETVLGRLSSGVISLDASGRLQTANQAAGDILKVDVALLLGQDADGLSKVSPRLRQFIEAVRDAVEQERRDWRGQITLIGGEGRQVLLCRGTPLAQPDDESMGYGLVFDDITNLLKAQRDAAWGEVARRLAHEIKNPLTPIQLSAERLRHKYLKTMQGKDADVLDRATHTIVSQVEAMKEMVNAFSEYARPSQINPQPLHLDDLVSEVLDLYRSAGLTTGLDVRLDAGETRVEADPVRLRQVVHNLIKNAQEAVNVEKNPRIIVSTEVKVDNDCQYVELNVIDNGPGFDQQILAHLFEPYVTTKAKGTGLGLAVVKKIAEEHGGNVWAENLPESGARLILRLPTIHTDNKYTDCSQIPEPTARSNAE